MGPIGSLRFPLKPGVVKRMISTARPATFGWLDNTCLDKNVRNVWKIPRSRVKIDKRRWNRQLNPILGQLKTDPGLPQESSIRAELYELLLYSPGQFFTPHQDSEKSDSMVATLVVVLPSQHKGGTLVIEHQGEKRKYPPKGSSGRRMHAHREIDAMGIPETHQTERHGSPYKLHLKKTQQLFKQDREERIRLKKAKDDLR